jgi:hypothetical protein
MKKLANNDIWDEPAFVSIKLEYQLIERYLFDKLADRIGVAYMNQEFLEWRFKISITKLDELLEAINPWWKAIGNNYYIRRDFLTQTQGGAIYLTSSPHQKLFEEMVKHKKNGFDDVVNAVRSANPELEVQTMVEANRDITAWRSFIESSPGSSKGNGYKQNIEAFNKNKRNFKYLGIQDFPPVNDGFELDIENEVKANGEDEDPKRPGKHPDQSKPIQAGVTQATHEEGIEQGYYMLKNGQYTKPLP